ncbi:MAG TPA: phytoene desaturase family protein [Actinomycetes bacterium]
MSPPTVVVGAGLAGLSSAIHLAAAGREVVVLEAAGVPGGLCGSATVGGYRFDTGPTVLTMPEVVAATVGAAGEELDDWLELVPLDPCYRIGFHDGSHLDVVPGAERMAAAVERLAGPGEAARYLAFRGHLAALFEVAWPTFVERDQRRLGDLLRPLALARVAALGGFRRLHSLVATHLTDWRLRRAHTFQALYVGLSPFDAPGVYAVVPYMDTVAGVVFPRRGGVHALPQALAGVAEKAGAELRFGARVERVEAGADGVTGVRLASGERLAARDVVVTADLPRAYAELLPRAARDWRLRRRLRFAPSCYLVHFGLPRRLDGQAHHTLHLGRDYKGDFEALTRRGRVQPDPSLLVTYPTTEDPEAAPPGHATLSVLEPTANATHGHDWARLGPLLRERLLARLARLGYGDLGGDAEVELATDPAGWAALGLSGGTPFSLDHRLTQSAWFRPAGACPTVPGLFFAGAGTVPGVGVPMVLISGRLAAERVLARDRPRG